MNDKTINEEVDLSTLLNQKFNEQSQFRYYYERDWYLNISFFLGYQYLFYNNRSRRLEHPQVPDWRIRLVFNYIKPIVISQVARILKARPVINVIPGSKDELDSGAARTGEKVLDYVWRKLKIPAILRRLALWFSVCGSSFLKVEWNPDAGDVIEVDVPLLDKTGLPMVDPMTGQPATEKKLISLGEIDITVLSPFEVYVDPKATTLEDSDWVMIQKFMKEEEIRKKWPKAADKVQMGNNQLSGHYFYESSVLNAFGTFGGGQYASQNTQHDTGALIQEWIFKPDQEHPHSRRVFITGTTVLEEYEDPDLRGDFPVFKFDDIVVPGRFFSEAVVQDLRPLNKEYNRTRSQIIEIKNLMAKPKWTVPKGAGVKASSITSEPGEVITYNGSLEPKVVKPPEIPQYVMEHASKVLEDMQNISNVRSVSMRPPSRITSGVAISAMQEQDDSAFGPTAQEFECSLEKASRRILHLVGKNYKEERLIQIVGRNGTPEVFNFKGADLGDNFDVIIQTGSSLPRSKVAKQELIMRLADGGWFGPKEDALVRRKVLKLLEMGSSEDFSTEFYGPEGHLEQQMQGGGPGQPVFEPGQRPPEPRSRLGDVFPGNPDVQTYRNDKSLARY